MGMNGSGAATHAKPGANGDRGEEGRELTLAHTVSSDANMSSKFASE